MPIENRSSKNDVGYQATPNKRMRCEVCTRFDPPNDCREVTGHISPKGWCSLYDSKRGAASTIALQAQAAKAAGLV